MEIQGIRRNSALIKGKAKKRREKRTFDSLAEQHKLYFLSLSMDQGGVLTGFPPMQLAPSDVSPFRDEEDDDEGHSPPPSSPRGQMSPPQSPLHNSWSGDDGSVIVHEHDDSDSNNNEGDDDEDGPMQAQAQHFSQMGLRGNNDDEEQGGIANSSNSHQLVSFPAGSGWDREEDDEGDQPNQEDSSDDDDDDDDDDPPITITDAINRSTRGVRWQNARTNQMGGDGWEDEDGQRFGPRMMWMPQRRAPPIPPEEMKLREAVHAMTLNIVQKMLRRRGLPWLLGDRQELQSKLLQALVGELRKKKFSEIPPRNENAGDTNNNTNSNNNNNNNLAQQEPNSSNSTISGNNNSSSSKNIINSIPIINLEDDDSAERVF